MKFWKNWPYWVRGGIIGGIIGLFMLIALWLCSSYMMHCLLEPIETIDVGGGSCYFKDYFSVSSLIYFGIPTFITVLVGLFIGWLYGKIKNRKINSFPKNY